MDKKLTGPCKNKLLFFSPNEDSVSYFTDSLIYIGEHTKEGSLGLIINRTLEITTLEFFKSMGIEVESPLSQEKILMGGPINPGAVFILHSAEKAWNSTMLINQEISLSTSKDILLAIALGKGPKNYLIMLGYSGWEGMQLDKELMDNAWIIAPMDYKILFEIKPENKVKKLSKTLGFDLTMVSPNPGNA